MKTTAEPIPFARFFLLFLAENLAFAIPALVIILLFDLLNPRAALFLFTLFILSCPLYSWISWLIAKGSNWVNTATSIKAAGGVSRQLYGVILVGFMGSHFFGTIGLVLMTAVFFGLGKLAGIMLGGWIANRYLLS